jgi:predicted metal-dependent phosphoesterase TrpH
MDLDLHIHSEYSFDSLSRVSDILKTANKKKVGCIAITDHNSIEGSLKALKTPSDIIIICASEIGTEIGDIIGLFINEKIKSKKSLEVIEEIKEQGGLSVLAHPCKTKKNIDKEIFRKIDAIEVFNARAGITNTNAKKIAFNNNLLITAGSDAHFCFEIGRGRLIIKDCSDIEEIRKSIISKEVQINGTYSIKYLDLFSHYVRVLKSIKNNLIIDS